MLHSLTDERGIAAVYSERPEREIHDELQKLDPDLFLDKEWDGTRVYYVVKHWLGSGHPPVPVVDWRDPDGTPRPLSHGLVEQVRKQGKVGPTAMRETIAANQARREKLRADAEQAYDDIGADLARFARQHFLVPRSQRLYLTRSRMRRKGDGR